MRTGIVAQIEEKNDPHYKGSYRHQRCKPPCECFATLSVASGSVTSTNVTIKDNHAGGGATFTAIDSVNVSGNTGWNFVSGWVPKTVWVITG